MFKIKFYKLFNVYYVSRNEKFIKNHFSLSARTEPDQSLNRFKYFKQKLVKTLDPPETRQQQ